MKVLILSTTKIEGTDPKNNKNEGPDLKKNKKSTILLRSLAGGAVFYAVCGGQILYCKPFRTYIPRPECRRMRGKYTTCIRTGQLPARRRRCSWRSRPGSLSFHR